MYTLLVTNFTPPLSQAVTNLGPPSLKYVTFSTYKLEIARYNLNFKLMIIYLYHAIFEFFKITINLNFFLKACTTY